MTTAQRKIYRQFRILKIRLKAGKLEESEVARLDSLNRSLAESIRSWKYVKYDNPQRNTDILQS